MRLPWFRRRRGAVLRSQVRSHAEEAAVIIRQTINIARHLLAGAMLGAMVIGMVKARRAARRSETLEPRYPPPEKPQPASQS